MKIKNFGQVSTREKKVRFKMWKSKKIWVFCALLFVSIGLSSVGVVNISAAAPDATQLNEAHISWANYFPGYIDGVLNVNPPKSSADDYVEGFDDGKADYASLTFMSATEKQTFFEKIKVLSTTSGTDKSKNLQTYVNDVFDIEIKSKNEFVQTSSAEIDKLPNLTPEQKEEYKSNIAASTSPEDANKIIDDAKAKDTEIQKTADEQALPGEKEDGKAAIDGLPNLSDAEKTEFKNQVDSSTTPADVTTAVEAAKDQDTVNKKAGDDKALEAAKTAGKADVDALPNLTPDEKTTFKDQIDAVTDPDDVGPIVNAAKAKDNDNKKVADDKALENAKTAGKADVDALPNLTPDENTTFKDQIDAVTNPDDVDSIVDAARTQDTANKKALEDAKTAGKADVDNLPNLTPDEKTTFKDQIDAVTNPDDVEPIVDAARTQDADNKKVADDKALGDAKIAGKADVDALPNLTPDEKTTFKDQIDAVTDPADVTPVVDVAKTQDATNKKALDDAKTAGKAEIDKLPNLSDEEKTTFKDQVDAVTDPADVTPVVEKSKTEDATNKKALEDAKTAGKAEIDKLPNLSDAEKSTFKDQIDAVKDPADVTPVVDVAKTQDATNKKALDDAKTAGKAEIDKLPNLSDEEKTTFKDQVDAVTDPADVTPVVEKSKTEDATNKKALEDAKTAGKAEIDKLPNLSDAEKSTFKDQIDAVKDPADVTPVVEKSKTEDVTNKKALEDAKAAGKAEIDKLPNLSDEEKTTFKDQVDTVKDPADVDPIVETAKTQDTANKKALEDVKTAGKAEIDKLPNLSEAEKTTFKDQVDTVKDPAEVDPIVETAKTQDAANKKALEDAKTAGKAEIDKLPNLSDAEKTILKDKIDAATDPLDVTPVVDAAKTQDATNKKALDDAKTAGKAEIDKLTNLSDEEKVAFKKQIDTATDSKEMSSIVKAAENMNGSKKNISHAKIKIGTPITSGTKGNEILPQTADTNDTSLAVIGAVSIITAVGIAGIGLCRKED